MSRRRSLPKIEEFSGVRLEILGEIPDCEIVHYYSGKRQISSRSRQITLFSGADTRSFSFPKASKAEALGFSRLCRRALRLDKSNIFESRLGFVAIRQGQVYFVDRETLTMRPTLKLLNCRNILHQSISQTDSGNIFLGEYGHNGDRGPVNVYRSKDQGQSWATVYEFPSRSIKHVHGTYWDRFEKKIWTFTGDFSGENRILISDEDFKNIEVLGDGSQMWRACNAFFLQDSVVWIMDSQLERSYAVRFDRASRSVEKGQAFPGPVWYIKELTDGWYLAATACEKGPGVLDNRAHLLATRDFEHWHEVAAFPHDGWPKGYFKFGVIGFADGEQSSQDFVIFGEALQGLDGRAVQCRLKNV